MSTAFSAVGDAAMAEDLDTAISSALLCKDGVYYRAMEILVIQSLSLQSQ